MAQRKFSPEVKERAVRMVFEQEGRYGSRWETVRSIAVVSEAPSAPTT